jgi:NAD(P) transhydrogenase
MREHYDIAVIGSGPGGEGAAMTAAKGGRRVAVIDADAEVGGSCTHRGTIPSKALRHAIQRLAGESGADPDYGELIRKAEGVIRNQVRLRSGFYERNHVEVIAGRATLADPHTIEVMARAIAAVRTRSFWPQARARIVRRTWISPILTSLTAIPCCD